MIIDIRCLWNERIPLSKIHCIVTPNSLNKLIKLSMNHINKIRNEKLSIRFIFEKLSPSTTREVIDNC